MAARAEPAPSVIVFARAPRLGRVKTRLASTIGEQAALQAHRELLRRTARVAASLRGQPGFDGSSLQLSIDGDDPDGECADLAREFGMRFDHQPGGDLGERMYAALAAELRLGRLPVLVGSDCPALQAGDLLDAIAALRRGEAVFAPAEDGGYVLVGLARACAAPFEGIDWGSHQVMEQTRARLRAANLRWTELRTLWDVDRPADWVRWREAGDAGR